MQASDADELDELAGSDSPAPAGEEVEEKLPPVIGTLHDPEPVQRKTVHVSDELDELDRADSPALPPKKMTASPKKLASDDFSELDDVQETAPTTQRRSAPRVFSVEPKTKFTIAGGQFRVVPSGGAAPFKYSVLSGDGTIDASGTFKAGKQLGPAMVRVEDARAEKRDVVISVQPPLELKLAPRGSNGLALGDYSFQVVGGAPPIRYSIDTSVSSEDPSAGEKDASGNDRGQAFLVVRDSAGEERRVSIQVARVPPLLAMAEHPEVHPDRVTQIKTYGGQGPFQYEVVSGDGKVDQTTGKFEASKGESDTVVKVTDAEGQSQEVKIKVANTRIPAATEDPAILSSATSGDRMVVAGAAHTCVLDRGELSCWGQNRFGEVGDGTRERRIKPQKVPGFKGNVISVVAGYSHTCALTTFGKVYCWGDNRFGQLGDGTLNSSYVPVPTPISRNVVSIAAGQYHSCALLDDGTAKCWGSNRRGQLGNGLAEASATPVQVADLGGKAREIAAGAAHTCAFLQGGVVKCWGFNSSGQLGDGTLTDRPLPTPVKNLDLTQTEAIALGGFHSCAKLHTGLKCWGANDMGQLGDGTLDKRTLPVVVKGLEGQTIGLSTGFFHTCALIAGNPNVQCWGWNQVGQIGSGDDLLRHATPAPVRGVAPGVLAIGCGVDHTCALGEDGLRCWGSNSEGQFGNRSFLPSKTATAPVPMRTTL